MKQLLLLLIFVSQPVWAEWTEISTLAEGTKKEISLYVDLDSIRKTENGRRMWHLRDFKVAQRDSKSEPEYKSSKILTEFGCAGERLRTLSISDHSKSMGTGDVVWTSNNAGAWKYSSPGSVGEALLGYACNNPVKR